MRSLPVTAAVSPQAPKAWAWACRVFILWARPEAPELSNGLGGRPVLPALPVLSRLIMKD